MVHTCSVYGCSSSAKHNKDLRFHRFPRDTRRYMWIEACRRPDFKNRTMDQLYNKYVCSLHFEEWMYKSKKLKSAATPVLNLPPADINPMSPQTEATKNNDITDLQSNSVQIDATPVDVSTNTCISATNELTKEHDPRKNRQREVNTSPNKFKLMKNAKKTHVARQQFLKRCDKFLSPNLSKIVKTQVNLTPISTNNRYTKEFKLFCLNTYYSSPHAYKFLSKTLNLPSKHTLATSAIPVGTQISDYTWGVLSQAIKHLPLIKRECTLCMDHMRLESSLFYDAHRDKIIGLHETDGIQTSFAAGYAFTIMLRAILGNWNQVVGYAFTSSSKIDESLEEWILNTIQILIAIGFKIRAVVSNHGSNFIKFSKTRTIIKENPYFEIDGKKIYYIFDIHHLIKSVRNNLINFDFEFNGKTASWDDINKCYQLDKQKDFRLAPKLTDSHISPNNYQKQNVRLATQVFSNSVKVAMETYTKAGELNPSDGTVEFIDTMEKLYDMLASSNLSSTKPYNNPYRDNELQRNLLLEANNLLSSLKVRQKNTGKDVTITIKFIYALSVTINAIIQLYDDMKKESESNKFYLPTHRLNNDSLENFFGIIRQVGGNCREPTCIQFERAFRKSFLCQIFKLYSETNRSDDLDNILSEYSEFTKNKSVFTRRGVINSPTNFDIPEDNSFLYICDYVLRRCVDKHKCLSTIEYVSYIDVPTSSNFSSRDLSVGRTKGIPADFVDYCNELEIKLRQHFRSFVGNYILERLFNALNEVDFKTRPCLCFPKTFMIKLFIRMRIHYIVNFNNRKLKTSNNKVSGKYLAVQFM